MSHLISLNYQELEKLNLEAKKRQLNSTSDKSKNYYTKYLQKEKGIKAVTLCFSDLEGKLQMLDYDKDFLIDSYDNLTFDGSSIRGYSDVNESDLRLEVDWSSFRWLPSDLFGNGKVLVFAFIKDRDDSYYQGDFRGLLKSYLMELKDKHNYTTNVAVECEGFLLKNKNAEQNYNQTTGFELATKGGYFNTLPQDELRLFIDKVAEVQRALGFENEKDHPEVAPAQFELNYKYTDALIAADQVQLYKLVSRLVASQMNHTASFLPKPIAGINGSGMHTNISISKNGKNIFYSKEGELLLSSNAWEFLDNILYHGKELCLILNPSVNSYRRLDPKFEAPNQIKVSSVDRTSMVRIPLGNEKSARVEVRTVAPDVNPYLTFYTLFKTGLESKCEITDTDQLRNSKENVLPGNIYEAIKLFNKSEYLNELMPNNSKQKYLDLKLESANRCPKELGSKVKDGEILYHHLVTNQCLWSDF